MKDYASMSDFEVNRSVAIAIGFPPDDCEIAKIGSPLVGVEWDDDTGYATKAFDFCNNPADAWPIIDDNNISLIPSGVVGWVAVSDLTLNGKSTYIDERLGDCFQHEDYSGLRAAMIVFLMMKEGE